MEKYRLSLSLGLALGGFFLMLPLTAAESAQQPSCTITGTAGDDVLEGTASRDVMCGLGGNDIIYGRLGADLIYGGTGDDQIFGGSGRDVMYGGDGFDFLRGDDGGDTMYGGPGGDTFQATKGSAVGAIADGTDVMVGGTGPDTVSYQLRLVGVSVTLDGLANDGSPGENDQAGVLVGGVNDVESVAGGKSNDYIRGDLAPNILVGGPGVDVVLGLGGNDIVDVRDKAAGDTADAGSGTDYCVADPGDALTSCETGPDE